MHRVDGPGAYVSPPESRPVTNTPGFFGPGNPATGTQSTRVPYEWCNAVQEEIMGVILDAGLTPDKKDNGQMAKALRYAMRLLWSNQQDYAVPSLVFGQDNKLYIAVAPSGPDISGVGAKTPGAAGSSAYWLDFYEPTDVFRKTMIGVSRWWRSTTLPANHIWANGDLVTFADWPEFKAVYDAGGFAGMLLEANANAATIAANLGKWKKHANGLGLYAPQLGGQFFRGWVPGVTEGAGVWQADTLRSHSHYYGTTSSQHGYVVGTGNVVGYGNISYTMESGGAETAPVHVWQPVVIYLGMPK